MLAMRARTHTTTRMSYHKFTFLIRGNNRPLSVRVVAIDLEALARKLNMDHEASLYPPNTSDQTPRGTDK